ncbi:hypothetical protein [Streptomyces sp. NRRL S-455]|uniref:hypothetical protein n=1 Tax=Streptomyces sp. NRRL S-455 TaxID=1463908 RepID=UPI0004BFAE7C|nr:hypothetical protein [Streptomyces sp. NRRL S-455]
MTAMDDGWHYGPDGTPERGFLEGTAFQPDDTRDHMDAWGSVHPENLKDCGPCRAESILTL